MIFFYFRSIIPSEYCGSTKIVLIHSLSLTL